MRKIVLIAAITAAASAAISGSSVAAPRGADYERCEWIALQDNLWGWGCMNSHGKTRILRTTYVQDVRLGGGTSHSGGGQGKR